MECSCALICSDCGICIHMYTCTCLDATLHCTICKHVHLLSMCDTDSDASENGRQISNEQGSRIHDTTDMQTESSVNFSTQRYFSNVLNRDGANQDTSAHAFQEVTLLTQQVMSMAKECCDNDDLNTLKTVQTHRSDFPF